MEHELGATLLRPERFITTTTVGLVIDNSGAGSMARTDRLGRSYTIGNSYSDLGRRDAALAAGEEAVKLQRELVAQNRDAFLPGLAKALGALGRHLLAAERTIDAAAAFQEGARLLRPLAQAMPAAFGGLFEALVGDFVQALEAAGRVEDIVPALTELGVTIPSEDGAPAP